MSRTITIELEMPDELPRFQLPPAVQIRLQTLLDQQDRGQRLTIAERAKAEGLVNIAETLSLLKLRAELASR